MPISRHTFVADNGEDYKLEDVTGQSEPFKDDPGRVMRCNKHTYSLVRVVISSNRLEMIEPQVAFCGLRNNSAQPEM